MGSHTSGEKGYYPNGRESEKMEVTGYCVGRECRSVGTEKKKKGKEIMG